MQTEFTRRVVIVIPASDQEAANTAATQLDQGGAGQYTFTIALSASGQAPATHYWCSAALKEEQYQQVLQMQAVLFPDARVYDWDMDANPELPQTILGVLELEPVEPEFN